MYLQLRKESLSGRDVYVEDRERDNTICNNRPIVAPPEDELPLGDTSGQWTSRERAETPRYYKEGQTGDHLTKHGASIPSLG